LVVTDNIGVVNEVPVARTVPVVLESANHFRVVPVGAVALSVSEASPQLDAPTEAVTAVGSALMIADTAVRVADKQPLVVFLDAA
jgi:hypothetical protein